MRRALEKLVLKVRGVDLEELEEEWKALDEAKAKREAERERARQEAVRREYEWERGGS